MFKILKCFQRNIYKYKQYLKIKDFQNVKYNKPKGTLLDNCHNLLSRSVIRWIEGVKTPASHRAATGSATSAVCFDVAPSSDEEQCRPGPDPFDGLAEVGVFDLPPETVQETDWAAYNRKQKNASLRFAKANPRSVLTISCIVLQPMVHLQRTVEFVDSDAWQRDELFGASHGTPCRTRVEIAATSVHTSVFFREVQQLLGPDPRWLLMPAGEQTIESMNTALSMLLIGMCGVEQLMHRWGLGYPCRLFRLIREPELAGDILRDCEFRLCPFSRKFLSKFPTVPALCSMEARMELFAAAVLLRTSICRIECRHALVRRHIHRRVHSHWESFQEASTAFVLARQRILEKRHLAAHLGQPNNPLPPLPWSVEDDHGEPPPLPVEDQEQQHIQTIPKPRLRRKGRFAGRRTGGGGLRRAALSQLLSQFGAGGKRGKSDRSVAFLEAHAAVKDASADDLRRWAVEGEAMTATHAVGYRTRPRTTKRKQHVGGAQSQTLLKRLRSHVADATVAAPAAPAAPANSALALACESTRVKQWLRDMAVKAREEQHTQCAHAVPL